MVASLLLWGSRLSSEKADPRHKVSAMFTAKVRYHQAYHQLIINNIIVSILRQYSPQNMYIHIYKSGKNIRPGHTVLILKWH